MVSKTDIAKALEEVRPHLQADGGDVELVDVVDRRRRCRQGEAEGRLRWLSDVADDRQVGRRELPQEEGARRQVG